jgi:hypothetical protein
VRTLLALVVAACLGLTLTPSLAEATAAAPSTTNHFITNRDGSNYPKKLGYNIFDVGASRSAVRSLPSGVRGLVWLGEKCPTRANDAFRTKVRRLADNRKVFGYYLSDEPHIADCPGGPAALASRARFIRKVSDNRQKSFIVLDDSFRAFRPSVTRVSMIGVDAYPCSTNNPTCDLSVINSHVNQALRGDIPRKKIVPVYQAFGQERTDDHYYNMPNRTQLRAILARWAKLVPNPKMDYTYGWGHQGSSNPTLIDRPRLQDVFKSVFR